MLRPVCPHCGGENEPDAAFCSQCGQAVPIATESAPRVIDDRGIPLTNAGQSLKSEDLARQTRKAAGALLAVAILQILVGTCLLAVGNRFAALAKVEAGQMAAVLASVYGMGVIYLGLYFWARKSPFPAAIVGLVIYVTVVLLDALADPRTILQGVIVKIIIIVVLVRAISAGAEHRKLLRQIQQ